MLAVRRLNRLLRSGRRENLDGFVGVSDRTRVEASHDTIVGTSTEKVRKFKSRCASTTLTWKGCIGAAFHRASISQRDATAAPARLQLRA